MAKSPWVCLTAWKKALIFVNLIVGTRSSFEATEVAKVEMERDGDVDAIVA